MSKNDFETIGNNGGASKYSLQYLASNQTNSNESFAFKTACSSSDGVYNYAFAENTQTNSLFGYVYQRDLVTNLLYLSSGSLMDSGGFVSSGVVASVVLGDYIYIFCYSSSTLFCYRYDAITLVNKTAITIPNFNIEPSAAFTNGTDIFIMNVSGVCRQYFISGTTMTFVQAITGFSGATGAMAESNTVYLAGNSKYTISGSVASLVSTDSKYVDAGISKTAGPAYIGLWYIDDVALTQVYNFRTSNYDGSSIYSENYNLYSISYARP